VARNGRDFRTSLLKEHTALDLFPRPEVEVGIAFVVTFYYRRDLSSQSSPEVLRYEPG